MVKFTLKQCAYFLAVAEHGGIAQAARELAISQPAIAQALGKLEDLYGVKLFVRHHARGVELTPQGRAFRRTARALLDEAQRAERDAVAIAANLAGVIRFGCFHTIAPFYMPQLIKGFCDIHRDVDVEASELSQDAIVAGVASGDLDLALTYDMALDGRMFDTATIARLEPFILVGSGHPLAARPSISLAEMAGEPFVMFDGPSSRDYFRSVLASCGIDPPVAYHSHSMESVRCAVANGLGFSLSVMRPAHAATYDGGLVTSVPIAEDVDPISVVLVQRQGRKAEGVVASFQEHCCAHFAGGF